MKKRTLILFITIMILGFFISCNGVSLPSNDVQLFEYIPDFNEDLDHYLKDLNSNYSYFPQTGKTYNENEFREATGYQANLVYPEIGTFWGISSIDNLGYGLAEFKSDEKVRIRMGSSSYIEEVAFTSYGNCINGPAPVIMLEFIFGDPVITFNGESYPLEDFTSFTDAHISSALWSNGSQQSLTPRGDEGLFSFYSISADSSSIKSLEFLFKEKPEFFLTKAIFYKYAKELNTIYSFEKPNAKGKLEFIIDKNTDQKDFDTILYYVVMLSNDGKYYAKTIIVDVNH